MSENMREAYTIKINFLTKERERENVNFFIYEGNGIGKRQYLTI